MSNLGTSLLHNSRREIPKNEALQTAETRKWQTNAHLLPHTQAQTDVINSNNRCCAPWQIRDRPRPIVAFLPSYPCVRIYAKLLGPPPWREHWKCKNVQTVTDVFRYTTEIKTTYSYVLFAISMGFDTLTVHSVSYVRSKNKRELLCQ